MSEAWLYAERFFNHALRSTVDRDAPNCIVPLASDRRFDHPAWRRPPYRLYRQAFLLAEQWWRKALSL